MQYPESTYTAGTQFSSKREQHIVFFLVSVGIVALTYGFFFVIDFLPEAPSEKKTSLPAVVEEVPASTTLVQEATTTPEVVDPFPVSITFDSLDKTIAVLNPESRSVAALDTALLSGVVRHPDSADFERTGTIFLLGHSSYLPNVINKNFQAFNGIQKLGWGDVIRLRSGDTEYVYHVDRTYEVKASDAEVEIEAGVAKLTLATCNSFGSKDDRFVVEATLVSKTAI